MEKVMSYEEIRALIAEMTKAQDDAIVKLRAEFDEKMRMLDEKLNKTNGGFNDYCESYDMTPEERFYQTLFETMAISGMAFDRVVKNAFGCRRLDNGTKIKGRYDVVLYNDEAICIVEVKYCLRADDIKEIAEKHPGAFRALFPEYDGYKIYLTVAGMSLEKDAEKTAKKLGIGVLRVNGDAIEVDGGVLKAF